MLTDPDPQTLRGIGLLYLACSHGVDGELADHERDLIVGKVQGRLVAASERQVYDAVRAAVSVYLELGRDADPAAAVAANVHDVAVGLGSLMSDADRHTLVQDLVEVARSDGAVSSPEREFIRDIANALSVTPEGM